MICAVAFRPGAVPGPVAGRAERPRGVPRMVANTAAGRGADGVEPEGRPPAEAGQQPGERQQDDAAEAGRGLLQAEVSRSPVAVEPVGDGGGDGRDDAADGDAEEGAGDDQYAQIGERAPAVPATA